MIEFIFGTMIAFLIVGPIADSIHKAIRLERVRNGYKRR